MQNYFQKYHQDLINKCIAQTLFEHREDLVRKIAHELAINDQHRLSPENYWYKAEGLLNIDNDY